MGEAGHVVGVDMTKEQLEVANKHVDFHTEKFGFAKSNVEFKEATGLLDLGLDKGSFDVIISNCVINLVKDKAVLKSCSIFLKMAASFTSLTSMRHAFLSTSRR